MSRKIFIIGLPRTGTTSACIACLELGFATAHTAYTIQTFKNAQVIADTPIFNDYQSLAQVYPNSRFIYLERDLTLWLPSISQLLSRMAANLLRDDGGFNDTIKRCFLDTFKGLTPDLASDYDFLQRCYETHKAQALAFLSTNKLEHIILDISASDSLEVLCNFLGVANSNLKAMPFTNKAGKVTAWNSVRHPLKVASTRNGKVDKDALLLPALGK
ncbi:sulfotransferase family protein [Pseudoalteromonas sp. JBTF-M23]|uniref:Sulfotransferase family protein n=1 Tax=Pseudoalteromonas caenipelagi TaxID=2726988 RepID=A0A849V8Q0_9GAMM|nr:sulfotransferase [Pseudoalteromonas caenipelagi]NOU49150.1 sulfotransferase family protein [Pseudoalteromonas caenipelagi]